jgi:hypothetical protein
LAGVTPRGYLTIPEARGVLLNSQYAGIELSDAVAELRSAGVVDAVGSNELQETTAYFWSRVDRGKLSIWAIHPRVQTRVRIDPLLIEPILRRRGGLAYLRSMHRLAHFLCERFGSSFRRAQLLVEEPDIKRVSRDLDPAPEGYPFIRRVCSDSGPSGTGWQTRLV